MQKQTEDTTTKRINRITTCVSAQFTQKFTKQALKLLVQQWIGSQPMRLKRRDNTLTIHDSSGVAIKICTSGKVVLLGNVSFHKAKNILKRIKFRICKYLQQKNKLKQITSKNQSYTFKLPFQLDIPAIPNHQNIFKKQPKRGKRDGKQQCFQNNFIINGDKFQRQFGIKNVIVSLNGNVRLNKVQNIQKFQKEDYQRFVNYFKQYRILQKNRR